MKPAAAAEDWKAKASDLAGGLAAEKVASRVWAKDPSLWKDEEAHAKIIANSLGWLDMPEAMSGRVAELEAFAAEVRKAGFRHAAVLGMGGSSLAPEVLRRTFPPKAGHPRLHVLDSTHPDCVRALEAAAPPAKTLYIVSSKSGGTVEPSRFMDYFLSKSSGKNFVAITDPGTKMESSAREKGFRRTFLNFPDIGGRYSALSYFGLVPAALLGLDLRGLLARASAMAQACRGDSAENPGLALGAQLASLAAAGVDKIILHTGAALPGLGLWLEQLLAESLGKEGKGVVPVADEPALSGPSAYSSDRAFVFLGVGKPPAEAAALARAGLPVVEISLRDPLDLGAEFYRWEFATAVVGHCLGVDAFDQPNVQAAKDRTVAVLDSLAKTGSLPELPVHAREAGLSLTFSKACGARSLAGLACAKPGDYGAILAYLPYDPGLDAPLRALRLALIGALGGAAVQLGFGPRYLHSTGQLHKGGPDSGIFLLLMRDDEAELPIPGSPYGFAQLCAAQCLGDFAALEASGRRAELVRFGGDLSAGIGALAAALTPGADLPGAV